MIKYRQATPKDVYEILSLIESGFAVQGNLHSSKEGQEHRVLFSYLYSRSDWKPEWLYLAEKKGKIAAAVGVFPKGLSFEGINIPVWAISPVVTAPQFRGQGLASECLSRLMDILREIGIPAVFLWGLPTYYPKLGFVPILPRYKTKLTHQMVYLKEVPDSGKFRTCNLEDAKNIADLYNHFQSTLWLQPYRSLEWWQQRISEFDIDQAIIKEVPFPKKENFLIWENYLGNFSGYLNFLIEENQRIFISEALATDFENAAAMLRSFLKQYLSPNQILYIRGTPSHPLNMAAYHLGGIHFNPAPLAGMVKIIDSSKFLNLLSPLLFRRLNKLGLGKELKWSWDLDDTIMSFQVLANEPRVEIRETTHTIQVKNRETLTKLLFGLYDSYDLENIQCNSIETFNLLFPLKQPYIWDANYLY